ncbi:Arm DNA-binding domain-containing protein [Thalassobacillus sp. C254]|uniref:site-specific integrase n=1 Tax=Thalassobacillus sp. C254 TaxID=1225341 RepID=UPI000ACF85AB
MKGYFRKRGSKWSFTIDAGKDHQGKRKQKTMTGFKTKKEAQAAAAELINKIERGTYLEPKSTTVTEFIEEWLEDAKNRLRPSVIENTKVVTNKWIIPDLGRHKLKDLKPHHVNNLYALMKSHNLSSDYIRYAHSILRKSFNTAVKWQILERNIIELVDPPRLETKEIETWTREEANAFLDVAKEDNPFYYIIYVLAIYTGMRRGEILGLRWKDVDLEEASLSVRQTLIKVNTQPVFQEPKTKKCPAQDFHSFFCS